MAKYTLTVYEKDGEKLLEEVFEAKSDQAAKALGQERLSNSQFEEHTSRLTSPKGQLILFHR